MPGLLKIGYTERVLSERLQEANMPNTWGPPTPYVVELGKHVREPNAKEQIIHKLLAAHRVNPRREFFRVDVEQVRLMFELADGTEWTADGESGEDTRVLGDDVITQFLNKHIYPSVGDGSVTWGVIAARFQTWKRETGISAGNAMNLRETLIKTYGKPNRGEGWSAFTLKA